jgi:hypothetical protein
LTSQLDQLSPPHRRPPGSRREGEGGGNGSRGRGPGSSCSMQIITRIDHYFRLNHLLNSNKMRIFNLQPVRGLFRIVRYVMYLCVILTWIIRIEAEAPKVR